MLDLVDLRSKQRHQSHQTRVRWAPSRLRRIIRHPAPWWLLAAALAVVGSTSLSHRVGQLDRATAAWGETRSVAVVTRPIAVGEPLAGAIEFRDMPVALLADSALSSIGDETFATVALHTGEVVLAERLSASASDELAPGMAAVTIALAQQSPLLGAGDLVDLWAVDVTIGESRRVATRVLVLDLTDGRLTVGVPEDSVGEIALAATRPITAALVG